ncbi:sensor histidine kinase [Paenibacillus luteus]|uniref:sensor histidine kinase n=1 Tax=Paenibacillus luteus TaxID=2545753 RepID=UPI0011437379|nr:histidine kinase [Paenibacillus luteus]
MFKPYPPLLRQYPTFIKISLLILSTTIIVMLMYSYSIQSSLNTVREDIQANNLNRIRFAVSSLDYNVEQLSMLAAALETDSKVALLPSVDLLDSFEQIVLIKDLTEKMNLQSFSEGWNNRVAIYSTVLNTWIGTSPTWAAPILGENSNDWVMDSSLQTFALYRYHDGFTIQVAFPQTNITDMLNRAIIDSNDAFFFKEGSPILLNDHSDEPKVQKLLHLLAPRLHQSEGTETLSIGNISYMVNYLRSETLGWYMIDYVPLDEALQPIIKTQNTFYLACIILLLASILTILFLYRKVQLPIVTLLKGVRLLKHGDFSYRIKRSSQNEFDILYGSFNDMASQIEDLIEKVYKEKIVSREAMVKQLQAQINPHFLYNCLFFINNMTRLGNEEAVTAMTQNLAEYFRYTTRLNEPVTTLEKEIAVVENYMSIQSLRIERLQYNISIPESMRTLRIPKLLIQPLVENSVVHGIENKRSAGIVSVIGFETETQYRISIEDDGKGLSREEIGALAVRIKLPLDDSMGCALWNIQQRMIIHFESPSGIEFACNASGGLTVTLFWPKP